MQPYEVSYSLADLDRQGRRVTHAVAASVADELKVYLHLINSCGLSPLTPPNLGRALTLGYDD